MSLRYLAGETEDMVETKEEVEKKPVGKVIEIEDIVGGEVVFASNTTDEEANQGDIFYPNKHFVRDIAVVVADAVIDRLEDKDAFSDDVKRYIHEQILEGVEWGLDTGDYSADAFEKWWARENGVEME